MSDHRRICQDLNCGDYMTPTRWECKCGTILDFNTKPAWTHRQCRYCQGKMVERPTYRDMQCESCEAIFINNEWLPPPGKRSPSVACDANIKVYPVGTEVHITVPDIWAEVISITIRQNKVIIYECVYWSDCEQAFVNVYHHQLSGARQAGGDWDRIGFHAIARQ